MTTPRPTVPAVVQQFYDLTRWYLERVEKFPRAKRFTLGDRLEQAALDCLEALVEAAYTKQKRPLLETANRRLNRLRILTRLATDLRCLSKRQQEFAAKAIDEVGRQIGGWIKANRKQGAGGGEKTE